MLGAVEGPVEFFEKFGGNTKIFLVVLGLAAGWLGFNIIDLESSRVTSIIFSTAPIWLPVTTFLIFFDAWLEYVRKDFNLAQGRVTLELKIPQEVFKSPEAMEIVINQLHQKAGPDNHVQTYWDGKNPPVFSLELVSRGGDVRMYINTPRKKFKNLVETYLYSQYPGIEVHELDIDYTAEIPWDPNRFSMMSFHLGLTKPDAYPIKTYIEYGLKDLPKEEEKVDPISTMFESLGNVGPGEYYWVQILITANRKVTFKEGSLFKKSDWVDEAREEIKKIIEKAAKRVGIKADEIKEKGTNINQMLTDTEKDTIKAIERSLGKNAFDVAIRSMYIAKSEVFNPGEKIAVMLSGWKSYEDLNRNSIGPRWRTDFDWNWWQDPKGKRAKHLKKEELNEYKRRTYTHHNENDDTKVMTTEELATVFHIPGKVVTTPTLSRIPSKRSEPPSNLPVG